MKIAAFVFCLLSLTCPAFAAFDDGNNVLERCTSQSPFDRGMCVGLIAGYFEGMQAAYSCSKYNPNITRRQIMDVVVKFLKDNPADRHLPGVTLSYRAFYVAFDCKKD
jgi:Ssp1 endopeptidase immunity protein Rap1a